jgi:hypothetical protein
MLDGVLASAARRLFAHNQGPARVVLDPIYHLVARSLLRGDIPLSPRLRAHRYEDDLYERYRRQSRKLQYFIEDWDFAAARPELLDARARAFVHTTTLGETSGMAVADGFLRAFRTSEELASFFGTWFVEELNHFRGFHRYTERMGERWTQPEVDAVSEVEFRPYSDDPLELAACNMFQELLAYLIYRSFAARAGDPFLARMVEQFSKDELRHFKFYEAVVARHIQRDPAFRVTVLKVFLKATTPFNQVSGGAAATLQHVARGLYYVRAAEYAYILDRVEYLLGTRLEPLFEASFRMMTGSCERCAQPTFRCECLGFS